LRKLGFTALLLALALLVFVAGTLSARFGWPPYPQMVRVWYALSGDLPRKRLASDRTALIAAFRQDQRPADLLLAGDSQFARGEWRTLLPEVKVKVRAIDGETSADLNTRLDTLEGAARLALLIGINDLVAGAAPARVCAEIEALALQLKPQPIWLFAVLPTRRAGWNEQVEKLNACLKIRSLANRWRFIELFSAGEPLPAQYAEDDLHLNEAGYRLLADRLKVLLEREP